MIILKNVYYTQLYFFFAHKHVDKYFKKSGYFTFVVKILFLLFLYIRSRFGLGILAILGHSYGKKFLGVINCE